MPSTINSSKTRLTLKAAVVAASCLLGMGAQALPTVVSSANDSGPNTLRDALESGANDIVITAKGPIMITEPLIYSGERPLWIRGNGQAIQAVMDFTLLEVASGVNLIVENLAFEGPGGFDIENQSSVDAPGKGIFVDVAKAREGWVSVSLTDVQVRDVANHGIHISDCDLADACGGGGDGSGGGSPASILLRLNNVQVDNVGHGKFDADGVRVDERGEGHIVLHASQSSFTRVGADGVELDEAQGGSAQAYIDNSVFNDNGAYCNPALLEPQLATFLGDFEAEGEFDESEQVTDAQIPGPPTGTLDDRCFEYAADYYDGGFVEAYEIAIDVDDGFDIDESDDGLLKAVLRNTQVHNNFDEGVDFDEAGRGNVNVSFIGSAANGNVDDGFKVSEADGAGIEALVFEVEARDNGGKGIVLEEADNGSVNARVIATQTRNNDDSDDTGLEVVQEDQGSGQLRVEDSTLEDGMDVEGVEVTEG
ncbi:hypothetical protein [Parahaliea mediterranea]|uniref:hypothetical protein n=1 Tax=Parahaliea mediterranea TaxID=651086 RepID=UPI001300A984|nr:hypothetical protein [Parahaliea mediterranea]